MVISVAITQILCFYGVILQRPCNVRVTTFLKRKKGPVPLKSMHVSCEISQLVLKVIEELKHSETTSDFFCLGIAE